MPLIVYAVVAILSVALSYKISTIVSSELFSFAWGVGLTTFVTAGITLRKIFRHRVFFKRMSRT